MGIGVDKELQDAISVLYEILRESYVRDLPDPSKYGLIALQPELSVRFAANEVASVGITLLLVPDSDNRGILGEYSLK